MHGKQATGNGTEPGALLLITALDAHGYRPEGKPPHWVALCPVHDDEKPSLIIDVKPSKHWPHDMTVLVFCPVCRASLLDVRAAVDVESWRLHGTNECYRNLKPPPPRLKLTPRMVGRWSAELWLIDGGARLDYLTEKRGLTRETIDVYGIGYDPIFDRYTLPVYVDELVNVRRYDPKASGGDKMKNFPGYGTPARLYPSLPPSGAVVVCEGEWDALVLRQHGIPAVTSTHGAATFLDEWMPPFADRHVAFLFDCDDAGRTSARKHAATVATVARVRVVDLDPARDDKWDVSDWFNDGRSAEELRALINATAPLGVG